MVWCIATGRKMTDLTTAVGFELESGDANSVNRWTKKGDRLYVNDLDGNWDAGYVDLQTGELEDAGHHVSADVTVEGDTLTISFECKEVFISDSKIHNYEVVVDIDWGESEEDEEGEPELVCDGGDDGATEHIGDETIQQAIESKDDPNHPDSLTIPEVRELLAHIQQQSENYWAEWLDLIDSGDAIVAGETDELVILDVGAHSPYGEELSDYEGDVEVDEIARLVVSVIHHNVANQHCDRNWGTTYPLVLRKPDGVDDGQAYVESVMAWLRSEGCSPGQAWHYYGVEIRGYSQSEWARRGHGDRSAISKAVGNAQRQVTR